ncbi:MAG: HEAT repeat domain-containing protein [Proteobacteria bacterium]|nr:HEAT repeat domain-containing protein [Pseudomonadota bacterium]
MRSTLRRRWAWAALTLACGAGACRRSPPSSAGAAVQLAAIEVIAHGWTAQSVAPSPRELRGWIVQALPRDGALVATAGGAARGPVYQLRLEVGLVGVGPGEGEDAPGQAALAVGVRARAIPRPPAEGRVLQSNLAVRLPAGRAAVAQALREATRRTVEGAVQALTFQAELLVGSEPRLLAALQRERGDRLGEAVETAAWRRCHAAVPRLLVLLRHDDPAIADRVIGALVAIGDRRALPALTRLARFEDTARLAKLIDAIATFGGDEARHYLEFVARGHPDPDIAAMAREARARMSVTTPHSR